jgi:protein gp37
MGENSAISWTDHTFNPWHGCTKIANPQGSGCDHCYAETQSIRYGRSIWGKDAERLSLSDTTWRKPILWNRDAERLQRPAFVFCASMGDVFEDRLDLVTPRARLFDLIGETPWLVWLMLTKRPEQMNRLAPASWSDGWPSNVWAGTSVEHQSAADLRIPRLLAVPAVCRFLSVEPMLGRVDLSPWLRDDWHHRRLPASEGEQRIDWVIVGGESGADRRNFNLGYFADLLNECRHARVPVWVKQDSAFHSGRQGRIPDAMFVHERPEPALIA